MKDLSSSKNSMVVTVSPSGLHAGKGGQMQQQMETQVAKLEQLAEESKPQWLKDAEQQDKTPDV